MKEGILDRLGTISKRGVPFIIQTAIWDLESPQVTPYIMVRPIQNRVNAGELGPIVVCLVESVQVGTIRVSSSYADNYSLDLRMSFQKNFKRLA